MLIPFFFIFSNIWILNSYFYQIYGIFVLIFQHKSAIFMVDLKTCQLNGGGGEGWWRIQQRRWQAALERAAVGDAGEGGGRQCQQGWRRAAPKREVVCGGEGGSFVTIEI
ncbi:unnamed protein product [Cuscuta europaea]|uniref:Uncharacterized protein n=1 Tax=Cuscuta europaea TaxID=41803 RepID=A0A9P1EHL1_CUSEU|nr:unnamed protein product [Cuscuta europaea]